jgi:hypothetical protein
MPRSTIEGKKTGGFSCGIVVHFPDKSHRFKQTRQQSENKNNAQ